MLTWLTQQLFPTAAEGSVRGFWAFWLTVLFMFVVGVISFIWLRQEGG